MMLALAGGFLGIWVLGSLYRLPQSHWWPLIPGGILTLIGLVQLGRTEVSGALTLWPVVLIIIGALVLGRTITRRG
jgi:predicted benzoate:H+ symporter BenE